MLQKVADPKKNISMHVLLWGMPDKEEEKKRGGSVLCWRGKRCGFRGRRFIKKKKRKVQQYRSCLNLDANFYCDFPLFIYINAGHILEFICTCMLSLSFLLVESVRMVIVCAFSF